jgi:protein YIPF5/7
VDFSHIQQKTLTVLNPFSSISPNLLDDSDLFGPIIFCLLFGTFLLAAGKVHFGYIYGLAAIGSVSLHLIFSLMSNPVVDGSHAPISSSYNAGGMGHDPQEGGQGTLTFFRSCSVLGYCLLPLVLTSFVGIGMNLDTLVGYLLTAGAVAWCTYSSSGMFCAVGRMRSMRPLVAYPLMLFYVGFGIMGIFSSRGGGGGALAGRAAG